jgi:hypothetical protein
MLTDFFKPLTAKKLLLADWDVELEIIACSSDVDVWYKNLNEDDDWTDEEKQNPTSVLIARLKGSKKDVLVAVPNGVTVEKRCPWRDPCWSKQELQQLRQSSIPRLAAGRNMDFDSIVVLLGEKSPVNESRVQDIIVDYINKNYGTSVSINALRISDMEGMQIEFYNSSGMKLQSSDNMKRLRQYVSEKIDGRK